MPFASYPYQRSRLGGCHISHIALLDVTNTKNRENNLQIQIFLVYLPEILKLVELWIFKS